MASHETASKQLLFCAFMSFLSFFIAHSFFQDSSSHPNQDLKADSNVILQLQGPLSLKAWTSFPLSNLLQANAFKGYLTFMITVMIMMIISKIINKLWKSLIPEKYQAILDIESFKKQPISHRPKRPPTSTTKTIIIYTVLYCLLNSSYHLLLSPSSQAQQTQFLTNQISYQNLPPLRILEEESSKLPTGLQTTSQSQAKQSISLSMGRVLSTLSISAYSVVLSRDGNTAFVSIYRSGAIKIIDVSNLESAAIISSVKLSPVEYPFVGKTLFLSPNGKTLFASNMPHLEIIDVSNIEFPTILAELEDQDMTKKLSQYGSKGFTFSYRVSMALSYDNKTLFIAGMGLQVVNISDQVKPAFISTDSKKLDDDHIFSTEIAISSNRQRLYMVANGSLSILDVTNINDLKVLGSYSSSLYSVTSVVSSKKSEAVFIIGKGPGDQGATIYEKINVNDPLNLTKLESYNLNKTSSLPPLLLAISSDENNAFILIKQDIYDCHLGIMNIAKNNFRIERAALFTHTITSLLISQDDSTIMVAAESLKIIELYVKYPNKRIFSLAQNVISTLKPISYLAIDSSILSKNGKILFLKRGSYLDEGAVVEIVNISNPLQPVTISYHTTEKPLVQIQVLEDIKKAFLVYDDSITMLDISDLAHPIELETFLGPAYNNILLAQFSSDGKRAYIVSSEMGRFQMLRVVDFSESTFENGRYVKEEVLEDQINVNLLTKDDNILFLMGAKISIYNVTDPKKLTLISSSSTDLDGGDDAATCAASFSADEKTLFLRALIGTAFSLRIYDIQNLSSLKLLGNLHTPDSAGNGEKRVQLSADEKMSYFFNDEGYLFVVNISNYSSPILHGTFAVGNKTIPTRTLKLSKDGQTAYVSKREQLEVHSLDIAFTLYLETESVQLGQKYSQPVALMRRNSLQEYEIMEKIFKFTKVSLFEIKINADRRTPDFNYLPFPYWMSFDKDNKILTIEPRKQNHLGTFTLYSAFSTKIPEGAFWSIHSDDDSFKVEDLITTLISLGYIDNQMFLTPNFGSYEDFIITTQYTDYQQKIFEILKQYYFETFTSFDIFPSLEVSYTDKILINTLSYSPVRVDIKLFNNENRVKFVNRQYSSIKPVITRNKDQITLEGSKKDVNNALQNLVINLEKSTSCDGAIVIWDSLNPLVSNTLSNISRFFQINGHPIMNKPIQEQIDREYVYTGEHFTIPLLSETFIDDYSSDLTYILAMEDEGKYLPQWISFSNMTLKGTPPEEIIGREIRLSLIVQNEFKRIKQPFVLQVRISSALVFKLLMKYSPYILTMIGLVVYANRIYNIFAKRRYRYPKDFYVNVGEEINTGIIPRIAFIEQEKDESKLVLEHLKKAVCKELGKESMKDIDLAIYFLDDNQQRLDKVKLTKRITEALQGMKRKLPLYSQKSEISRNLIHQIIFNKLTLCYLKSQKGTMRLFEEIQEHWADVVEWDNNAMCTVNEERLQELLTGGKQKNGDYHQMIENNVNLLKDAIEGYAFMNQHLDYLAIRAHVVVREKVGENVLKEFFKIDLERVNFSDKGKMGYGIYYKIENDKLCFYGVPEEKFENKALVVQVTDLRHRILREMWIIGTCDRSHEDVIHEKPEGVARGQGYEIY